MHEPEVRLYVAVMMQAVSDLTEEMDGLPTDTAARIRARAVAWVLDDTAYPFSFRDSCRVLGLNVYRGRTRLIRLAKNRLERAAESGSTGGEG